MKFQNFTIAFAVLFFTGRPLQARFHQNDAQEIDREERQEQATWHDGNTYRFYPRWQNIWREKDLGYRISDGSYDADRSRLHEQIKLATQWDQNLSLSYRHDHFHDMAEQLIDDELRLTLRHAETGLFIGPIVDGNTSYKQWGDLGLVTGYRRARRQLIEFYAWSVDHFYNSKQEVEFGEYDPRPHTFGSRVVWDREPGSGIEAGVEIDQPLSWHKFNEEGFSQALYNRSAQRLRVDARHAFMPNLQILAAVDHGKRKESLSWTATGLTEHEKSLSLAFTHIDFSILKRQPDASSGQLGVLRILRNADYSFTKSNLEISSTQSKAPSPDQSRRETIGYYFHQIPISAPTSDSPGQFLQLGYTQAWIQRHADYDTGVEQWVSKETRSELANLDGTGIEQKLQVAFELWYAANISTLLNATLDVDGIAREFPYTKRPTPGDIWDGGGVQFMMTF